MTNKLTLPFTTNDNTIIDANDSVVVECNADGRTSFITNACNSHYGLIDALYEVMEWIDNRTPRFLEEEEWYETEDRVKNIIHSATGKEIDIEKWRKCKQPWQNSSGGSLKKTITIVVDQTKEN